MAVFSPLTSRRASTRAKDATQQLIVFHLEEEGFALPIRSVQKVIPMGNLYGGSQGTGLGLTLYQDQELLVINVGQRIFKNAPTRDFGQPPPQGQEKLEAQEEQPTKTAQRFLLIVQSSRLELIGLPIDSPPSLQRVPESAFTPLTATYIAEGNLQCVSALVLQKNGEPPLFLLNPEKLVQSQTALPGT